MERFPGGDPESGAAVSPPSSGFTPYPLPRDLEPRDGAEAPAGQTTAEAPDWQAQIEAANARAASAETQSRQLQQNWGEVQTMLQRAQIEAQEQQAQTEAQQRVNLAYQMAADMDPETALQYVRRAEEAEKAGLAARNRQIQEDADARLFQTVAQIAGPQYARERGSELGLPDKYVQRLAAVPSHLIDALLPFVQEFAEQETTFQTQLDQVGRSTRAGEMAASGVYAPAGTGAQPVRLQDERLDPHSDKYERRAKLANILQRAGIIAPRPGSLTR